jgi:hypothetical protein
MSLDTNRLKKDLKEIFLKMEPDLKDKLYEHLSDRNPRHTKKGVNEKLKMGGDIENTSNSIYSAQERIDKWLIENREDTYSDLTDPKRLADYKDRIWGIVSKEWADSLSYNIARDVSNTMAEKIAPEVAKAIEKYIKNAQISVYVPKGILGDSGILAEVGDIYIYGNNPESGDGKGGIE